MISRRQLLASAAALRAAPARRPNFIVFLTDDLGGADLGCYGARDLKTPNIDALAASGARFTNWYSNAPLCAPARAALMTGRYPIRAGVPTNGPHLAPSQVSIAGLLKPLGYRTALTGKWHLGNAPDTVPNAHGFDHFYGFHSGCVDFYSHRYYWGEPRQVNYHDLWRNRAEIFEDGQYLTERITAEARAFIESGRSEPFFLYAAYNAPHYPMHAPKKYMDRFPDLEPERRTYAAMIAAVDDGVGEIMSTVRRLGLLENTLVFFLADNGATTEKRAGLGQNYATAGSNGVYRGFKFSLFDGGMHVPAIVSWPGRIPAGGMVKEMAASMDVFPTIARAAGASVTHAIDGKDILPVAATGARTPHEALFWAQGQQRAVRRGPWKLVRNGFTADRSEEGRKPMPLWLSNLDNDPGETANLAARHPNLVDELETLLARWEEQVGAH